ncbi:MAG: Phosphate acetyltransferase [Alphaproteobacteria bacterium MarineAlpha3_Bin5]|nr:phosphate acetyltransferase [Magnetovibrio sp.]PPR78369.1 MAG: Phosphate acetyltransferase [Alphaproteobacteria bacterium MarineAlpha3_Bin5]
MLSSTPFQIPPYLLEQAKGLGVIRTAIAGADHPIALESARQSTRSNLIQPLLIGNKKKIQALADSQKWDIQKFQIINATGEKKIAEIAASAAKHNEVKTIMKGQIHTDSLMKAVLNRDAGLRTEKRLSHIFHMTIPNNKKNILITDGALNVAPDTQTKIDIVKNSIALAHALGKTAPRIAMLSATEAPTKSMPSSLDAKKVVEHFKDYDSNRAIVDGPFALDIAVSQKAARLKGVESLVAGAADVLVVPNIEMGNGLFKMMVYFLSGLAAGIVMGAKVPIVLTSRADPPEARLAAAAIAVIVSAKGKGN